MLNATTNCVVVDGGVPLAPPHHGQNVADLLITVAYFSIPFQILCSLYRFPFLTSMPPHVVLLLVLFAFFIFLCGAGHLLHHMQLQNTALFERVNALTALVSVTTALYLLPIIPSLFSTIDSKIKESIQLNHETAESKDKLVAFMAFLCHEIRNPLFAITSSVQSLREDYTWTGEPADCLESIHDASLLMLRLVNDVLDLSKMDAGKLTLEERNFDFRRLLQNLHTCVERQLEGMHGEDVRLVFRVQPAIPRVLFGDSTRILQIVYNILSNSVKFTTHGTITFDVRLTDDIPDTLDARDDDRRGGSTMNDASEKSWASSSSNHNGSVRLRSSTSANPNEPHKDVGDTENDETECLMMEEGRPSVSKSQRSEAGRKTVYLHIACQDTGVGIAPDRIKTIFEPYSQAKLSDYRKHGGTGLGLSVISSLLRVMGGSIQVESELGVGSTFELIIPMQVPIDQDLSQSPQDDEYVPHYAKLDHVQHAPPPPPLGARTSTSSTITSTTTTSSTAFEESPTASSNHVLLSVADAADLIASSTPTLSPSPRQKRSRRNSMDSDTLRATRRLPPLFDGSDSFTQPVETDEASFLQMNETDSSLTPSTQPAVFGADANKLARLQTEKSSTKCYTIESVALPRAPHDSISVALALAQELSPSNTPDGRYPALSRDIATLDYQKAVYNYGDHSPHRPSTGPSQAKPSIPVLKRAMSSTSSLVDVCDCDSDSNGVAATSDSKQVLVADDNVVNRKIIGKMLTNFGIDFDLAAHGQEAVDLVRSQSLSGRNYGLVFMDLSMPVLDGYDAIQIIRSEFPSLPIVALTANALTQEKQRAIQAGATEFKTKPILRHDLLAVCRKYMLSQGTDSQAPFKAQSIGSPRHVSAGLVD